MENQEIAKVLNQIADFYEEDASRWTQGTYARDINGKLVAFNSSKAVCWCTSGAIGKFSGNNTNFANTIHGILVRDIQEVVSVWNDNPFQTVENVIATLRKIANEL